MFSLNRLLKCAAMLLLTSAAAQAQTGTISGTITTAAAVTSSVTLYDANGRSAASTFANGSYSFSGLAPGTYYVKVSAPGYVTELFDNITCVAEDCVVTDGTPIVVTSGGTATANFTLAAGGRIQGTVRRASDSTGVSNVAVFIYNAATSLVRSVQTAADGTYESFSDLPAGNYYLRIGTETTGAAQDYVQELFGGVLCPVVGAAGARSFACRIAQGTTVSVSAGATTTGVDFSLDHGARINGQVTLGAVGLANVTVTAYSGTTPIGVPVVTDANGFYTLQGLPPGTYFVRATPATSSTPNLVEQWYNQITVASGSRPTSVTLAAGATATNINFPLLAGGVISGTVTFTDPAAGTPFPHVPPTIEVYNAAGTLVKSQVLSGGSPINYTVDGLPTGTYYVKAASTAREQGTATSPGGNFIDELYNGVVCVAHDCAPTSGTPVSVTAGANTSGINFALDLGGSIVGAVAARPFVDASDSGVDVYDSRGVLLPRRTFRSSSSTLLLARYGAVGLPSGTYYLVARRNDATGNAAELYRGQPCAGCAVTFGTPVVVTAGATVSGIDFTGITGGTIAGTVRDNLSAPLSTITVEVYAATGALAGTAVTSSAGTYRIAGLAPATYFVRTLNARGYVDEVHDNITCAGCPVTSGTAVTVTASTTTTVNFALTAGVSVGGTVRAEVGNAPLPGTRVSLFSATGTLVARASSNELGVYAVSLAAGTYRARSEPRASYVQELYNNMTCANGTCDVTTGTPIVVAVTPVTNVDFSLATCTPRTISPTRLATAAVGSAYRQVVVASGGTNRVFAIAAGALPPGLTLDPATGVLSGNPTASGSFTFTVSVTDSTGCVSLREYTLDVPACAFVLASTTASVRAAGDPLAIPITSSCGTVTAASNDSWITVTSSSSTSVGITVAANTATTPRTGTVAIGPRVFTVFQSGTTNEPPFGTVDTPIEGSSAAGSIAVTGWALDNLGVNRVMIYRDPVGAETPGVLVFIGQGTFVTGARPDVEATFPTMPFANRAGWGYLLLTNMLPNQGNGTFRLSVYAEDGDSAPTLLGTRTIVGVNATATAPFGAIDTPAQGATISGTGYTNFGWALTPQPKQIPFSGSSISVFIDGASIGTLSQYNLFRSDVSNLFPNLKNSGGPVGFRTLDTTALTEGVHTISWVAIDDAGVGTGIGSRYFNVNNSAWQPSLTQGNDAALAEESMAVPPPRVAGVDLGRRSRNLAILPAADATVSIRRDRDGGEPEVIEPTETGLRIVTVKELERIELEIASAGTCTASYAGYLSANGEVRDLPLGASLDASGRFYWQTTPGFIGNYRIVFVRTACDGTREQIPVSIRIAPK